jgi:endonuclease III
MTLRGMSMWGTATWVRVDDSGVWYARRTPDGPGTVHIRVHGGGLVARAFGDGAAHLLDDVPGLCGLGNQGIGALGPACEVVHELKKRSLGYRTPRSGQVFPQLVSTALAQKVTGQNSAGAVRRIARAWGERAPGPRDDLWLLPLPRELERRPPEAYVPMGVERRRADLVRRIASRWSALEKAARMPGPEARAHLEKLPGIGPWTSGVVVGGPLGDPDAVPIGDYHLPDWVTWNLARRPRGDDDTMMRLLEPYAGLRGMVARMITMRGSPPPRWGPRTTPRDIREPW